MKNKLLITTALVATAFVASNVMAADRVNNSGNTLSEVTGTFENLSSSKDGGAVYNRNSGKINSLTGTYTGNTASNRGGAIYNAGTSIIKNISAIFNSNTADKGGAISNAGTTNGGLIKITDSTFELNKAKTAGGAIHNMSEATLDVTDSKFNNNQANVEKQDFGGGAIYNRGKITANITTFDNNHALFGGAIHNFGDLILGNGSEFTSNTATKGNGGAINNEGGKLSVTATTFTKNKSFKDGTAKGDGAAIYNGGVDPSGEIITSTITSSTFCGNEAENRGGAIYNASYAKLEISKSDFTGNTADKGGAISNAGTSGQGTITLSDSTFTNNAAKTAGGAIHNMKNGIITFKGTNTFSGNNVNGELNDIYNNGEIVVDSGATLVLDGGISRYSKDAADGAAKITFGDNSHLSVKVDTTRIDNNVTIGDNAKLDLVFANGYKETTYDMIVDGNTVDGEFVLTNEDNGLYKITRDEADAHKFTVTKKSTEEVAASTGANANQAATIGAVTSGNTGNATFDAAAENINNALQSSNPAEVQAALDAVTALAPEVAPAVQSTSTETTNQVFGAVGTRLSGGSVSTGGEGMSSGDNIFERAAMWVQTLFNKSKLDDTSKAKGFDTDSNGIAFGAEKFINDDVKVGVGYAYTNTDIDGFMRTTDVDTHTAILYGEYKPSNWYVNGIATYGWSDYSEKKNVAGVGVKADYDVDTFGLQAMSGYDMNVKGFGFTPEAGLRYVHIKQDAYTDSADQKVSGNDSDILTGVIGAKVSKSWELSNGMNIKPEARIAATYDLMNDDVNSVVTLANGSAYAVEGKALDRFGMEFGAGVTAEVNDKVELSLGYEGKFRENYQDHTGLLNAKYKF